MDDALIEIPVFATAVGVEKATSKTRWRSDQINGFANYDGHLL